MCGNVTYIFHKGAPGLMNTPCITIPPASSNTRTCVDFRVVRGVMLSLAVALLLVNHLAAQQSPPQAGEIDREYSIKGAFLYNFGRYVQWPNTAFASETSPFVIGVLGTDPFGTVLDDIASTAKIDGRAVVAKRFATMDDYTPCQILFISATADPQLKATVLEKLPKTGLLVVSEEPGLAQRGAVVNFFVEQNKVRFEINVEAARQRHLKVSSKLLSLAKIVGVP